jgi:hypothetical protein
MSKDTIKTLNTSFSTARYASRSWISPKAWRNLGKWCPTAFSGLLASRRRPKSRKVYPKASGITSFYRVWGGSEAGTFHIWPCGAAGGMNGPQGFLLAQQSSSKVAGKSPGLQAMSTGPQGMSAGVQEGWTGRRKVASGPNQVLSRSKSLCMHARVH